ncbi:TonB-dependent receptor [Sinimarinibacterium thermocellulolyticum]|uniref:TonB-dependent receptor plug domain-containing protein n=1 Tax=Sinimarinibacterium thermocellulolyticum TaxID=3170016 RepID=A0ABV2ADW7_9GAMM
MTKLVRAGAVLVFSVCGGIGVADAEDARDSSSLEALLTRDSYPDQSTSSRSEQQRAESAPIVDTIPVADPEMPEEEPKGGRKSSNRLVEEIIVTAQKREERLQDVPISVQAFSQEKLEALGIQTIQQVQRATPGFTVTQSSGFNVTFLRGVGSDAFLPGVDSSVPFYLDGVPLMAIQASSDTLGRIERVEVLKGPQGTLFGRNATGGTVSVVTPDPDTQAFFGDFKYDLGLGRYGQQSSTLYVNVPIGDSLAVAVSGFQGTRDHVITNVANPELPDLYTYGGRLKLRWDVTDDVVVSASGSFQQSSTDGGLF